MKSNLFVPDRINVGFQNRSDTYTKKLAYIIYWDEKGKLRKETSWTNWRDKKIDPIEYENVPTEGFVLNKKAGGYRTDWNTRRTVCRIYDPRGFEFEISIENLLYILENNNCIKGKGLEGEFVYSWDSSDLVLMPVASPDYKEIKKFNDQVKDGDFVKAENLVVGRIYKFKDLSDWIYLGRYQKRNNEGGKEHNSYFFYPTQDYYLNDTEFSTYRTKTLNSVSKLILKCSDEEIHKKTSDLVSFVIKSFKSDRDQKKDEFVPYTYDEFYAKWKLKTTRSPSHNYYYHSYHYERGNLGFWTKEFKRYTVNFYRNSRHVHDGINEAGYYINGRYVSEYVVSRDREESRDFLTLQEVFDTMKPGYLNTYDYSGNLLSTFQE